MTNNSRGCMVHGKNTTATETEMKCFNHAVLLLMNLERALTVEHMDNGWTTITLDNVVQHFDNINKASVFILATLTDKHHNDLDGRESVMREPDLFQINTPDFQQARQSIEDRVNGEFEQHREEITESLKAIKSRGFLGVEVGWTYSVEGIPFLVHGVNFTQRLIGKVYYTVKAKGEVKELNTIEDLLEDLKELIKHAQHLSL